MDDVIERNVTAAEYAEVEHKYDRERALSNSSQSDNPLIRNQLTLPANNQDNERVEDDPVVLAEAALSPPPAAQMELQFENDNQDNDGNQDKDENSIMSGLTALDNNDVFDYLGTSQELEEQHAEYKTTFDEQYQKETANECEEKLVELRDELAVQHEQYKKELAAQLEYYEKKLDEQREDHEMKMKQLANTLKEDIQRIQLENNELSTELESVLDTKRTLKATLKEKDIECVNLKSKLDVSNLECTELKSDNARYQNRLDEAKSQMSSLKGQYDSNIATLISDKSELQESLRKLKTNNHVLQSQNDAQQDKLNRHKAEIETLESTTSQFKEEKNNLEMTISTLKSTAAETTSRHNDEKKDLEMTIAAADSQLIDKEEANAKLSAELEDARAEIEEMKKKVDEQQELRSAATSLANLRASEQAQAASSTSTSESDDDASFSGGGGDDDSFSGGEEQTNPPSSTSSTLSTSSTSLSNNVGGSNLDTDRSSTLTSQQGQEAQQEPFAQVAVECLFIACTSKTSDVEFFEEEDNSGFKASDVQLAPYAPMKEDGSGRMSVGSWRTTLTGVCGFKSIYKHSNHSDKRKNIYISTSGEFKKGGLDEAKRIGAGKKRKRLD